ncbi:MAG: restriction endonuclease subunit S [Chlorobium sp.]|jgi:type I restriction enzyme S subunit|nr:restriction endonuclease subunit S [Chlorobium sp.]
MKTMLLGDVARIKQGYTFKPKYQGQQGKKWPYIKVADVGSPKNTKYLNVYLNSIDDQALKEINVQPFVSGSIVFPRVGAALRNNNKRLLVRDCLTDDNVIVITVKNTDQCYNEFLYYWFVLKDLAKFCNDGLVPVINAQNLKIQKINLPSLSEQKAIAELLSVWDEAIEKTERLIQAKEKLFRGYIQSKIGLKSEEWLHIKPKKIFDTITEKGFSDEELLSVTQNCGVIPRSMLEGRVMSPDGTTEAYKRIKCGDFAISLRSFQGGIEYSNYQGLISPAYTVLRPKMEINIDFYRLFFKSYLFGLFADYRGKMWVNG